ncbi:PREDICTED: THAP domain-containing protein 1-like [Trachymyrmex cornetzi]|uniref:THAP domain-containing protein 1-like n=1 Tax=Trachymyrmex cornetzi TaxID=471704 RepID=UPI00084EE9AA|nr:PREDICTED: THAP domain-containing protein 1-like [Trachymyrmex cornetzi]
MQRAKIICVADEDYLRVVEAVYERPKQATEGPQRDDRREQLSHKEIPSPLEVKRSGDRRQVDVIGPNEKYIEICTSLIHVYTCWVCKWRGDKEPKRSFHNFPSCENERKKWKHILGINIVLGARTTICSLHFTEDCFHYGVHGRRLLKEGSFPSLYLPTPAVAFVLEERTGPLTNESECSTKNIAIKRSSEVIEDGIPNKQICLKNEVLERSTTEESAESNLSLQYLQNKMIFKNKEISSLKRKNWRLSSRLKQVQTKNTNLITEKTNLITEKTNLIKEKTNVIKEKKLMRYVIPRNTVLDSGSSGDDNRRAINSHNTE